MSDPNPVTNAFFFGRALAEVFSEKLEELFTNAMSDLGKFDAEQRENLRQFMEEVQLRAENSIVNSPYSTTVTSPRSPQNTGNHPIKVDIQNTNSDDLQEMLDQLRAEIATLRSELKKHRS